MYRGKFENNNRSHAEPAEQKIPAAPREPSQKPQQRPQQKPQQRPSQRPQAPQQAQAPRAPQQRPVQRQNPAPRQTPRQTPQPVPKKGRKGTLVFYSFYFSFVLLFVGATFLGLQWLHGWLSDYEQAQPDVRCEEIFQQLFRSPDWGMLYDMSGAEGSTFEGRDAYVAHMSQKVGSSQLTYQETSAGLSGDKKYFFKLGDEKLGWFTLHGETDSDAITAIPDWQLDQVEVFLDYSRSYDIVLMDGHTAYVNDVPLDESYTIQIASTLAENYLPTGTTGIRMCTQRVTGLMAQPVVTIFDEDNQPMEVRFDEATRTFTEQTPANTITEEQQSTVVGAMKAYAEFMIESGTRANVAKYFDASSDIYHVITTGEKWMQSNSGHTFTGTQVSGFCMYSDDLFSARVVSSLDVTRKDGTVRSYPIDITLFFELQSNGRWLAYDMTNEDVQKPVGKVRLTFMDGDTQLATGFYDTDSKYLDTPMISVPEGKVFSGWVRTDVDENGVSTLTVVFTPDESGHVDLPAGNVLTPMVLTALFEYAPAE